MAEMADPEQITIIEGPTPEFHVVMDPWTLSLLEGHIPYIIATCQVRSYNGEKLMERCLRAWDNHRVIKLDYRQIDGLRRQVDIVSARLEKIEEVDVLNLWVRQPVRKLMNIVNDDSLKFGDDE